ncbi:MAG: hypothetical protein ACRD11_02805 [Terriglobia bacterium]
MGNGRQPQASQRFPTPRMFCVAAQGFEDARGGFLLVGLHNRRGGFRRFGPDQRVATVGAFPTVGFYRSKEPTVRKTLTVATRYQLEVGALANHLQVLSAASTELVAAEGRIRAQLGTAAEQLLANLRDNVIVPLADALVRANNRDGPGAVQQAGNAVEAHIDALATRQRVVLTGATGIISKLQRFENPPRRLPAKLVHVGTYLGSVRNAADHGTDPHISNTRWNIRDATGLEYVYVACSFIAATIANERGDPAEI